MLRKATAAVLLGATVGCHAVRPVAVPSTFIPEKHPARIWVADPSGETFQLLNPTVRGDTVVGTLAGTTESMAVPLTPEHVVFARQKSGGKTAQLVAAIGVVGGLAVWGLAVGGSGEKGCAQPGMRGCPPQ